MKLVESYKRRRGGKVLSSDDTVSVGWRDNPQESYISLLAERVYTLSGSLDEMEGMAQRILEAVDRAKEHAKPYHEREE